MSEYRHSNSVLTPTAYNASDNTDTSFPATNVGTYSWPNRIYKSSTVDLADWVGVDLGSAKAVTDVVVDNVNVSIIKIQASSTSIGDVTPDYTTGVLSVAQNPVEGKMRYILRDISETYRYWWVLCQSIATYPTGGVFSVGSFTCLSATTTWSQSPERVEIQKKSVIRPQSIGGGGKPVGVGNRYAHLRIPPGVMLPGMRATLNEVLGYGEDTTFLMDFNDGTTYNWYWVNRIGDTEIKVPGSNMIEISPGMLLKTVVD